MKFKCNKCPKSGTQHERCEHYHEVKAELARISAERLKERQSYIKTKFNYLSKEGV